MKRFEALTESTGETPDPYEKRRLPMANRKRNIQMKFYVTEEEKRLIDEKMAQLPTRRYGAYLRKMAIGAGVCAGSRMLPMGKHPRRPLSGALRGKNRGFRTLIDTFFGWV